MSETEFKITNEEIIDLQSFRNHCERTTEYIDEYLQKANNGVHDADLLSWIYVDNARGIELIADWNVMHNEIRTIQELQKRFENHINS